MINSDAMTVVALTIMSYVTEITIVMTAVMKIVTPERKRIVVKMRRMTNKRVIVTRKSELGL